MDYRIAVPENQSFPSVISRWRQFVNDGSKHDLEVIRLVNPWRIGHDDAKFADGNR
jgi:hypothetical protein